MSTFIQTAGKLQRIWRATHMLEPAGDTLYSRLPWSMLWGISYTFAAIAAPMHLLMRASSEVSVRHAIILVVGIFLVRSAARGRLVGLSPVKLVRIDMTEQVIGYRTSPFALMMNQIVCVAMFVAMGLFFAVLYGQYRPIDPTLSEMVGAGTRMIVLLMPLWLVGALCVHLFRWLHTNWLAGDTRQR